MTRERMEKKGKKDKPFTRLEIEMQTNEWREREKENFLLHIHLKWCSWLSYISNEYFFFVSFFLSYQNEFTLAMSTISCLLCLSFSSSLPLFYLSPLSHVLTTIVIIKPFSYRMQQKSATNLVKQTQKTSENTPSFFTCHF